MQDEGTHHAAGREAQADLSVLGWLLDPEDSSVWSAEEVARELGSPLDAEDSLARLAAVGLIHRLDGFAFPTRAAVRFEKLAP